MKDNLRIRIILRTFAAVNRTKKQRFASLLLLAVFVPMVVFSSLHVHGDSFPDTETECTDCVHHSCHGHLTQTSLLAHDCVLCQFLTLTTLTATVMAVRVFTHVCKTNHAQPLCSHHAACCGFIVTRGPPSV